jgi:rhamnosyl/mannosyltransferase
MMYVYAPLMHWFLHKASAIVAASPQYLESSPVLARYRDKTSLITYGIDKARIPTPSATALERMRKRIGHERFFCFVGVLRYYKGLHHLLQANQHKDWPLVIAGSGPKETELMTQAQSLGLKNTIFLGAISDEEKWALLHLAYGFVFPSHLRSEAFGISLLEAAIAAKPLICCEIHTGTSYINQHGVTGICVPPSDPLALRDAMAQLWSQPDTAKQMGEAARQRYEVLFQAGQMAECYTALYRQLQLKQPGLP